MDIYNFISNTYPMLLTAKALELYQQGFIVREVISQSVKQILTTAILNNLQNNPQVIEIVTNKLIEQGKVDDNNLIETIENLQTDSKELKNVLENNFSKGEIESLQEIENELKQEKSITYDTSVISSYKNKDEDTFLTTIYDNISKTDENMPLGYKLNKILSFIPNFRYKNGNININNLKKVLSPIIANDQINNRFNQINYLNNNRSLVVSKSNILYKQILDNKNKFIDVDEEIINYLFENHEPLLNKVFSSYFFNKDTKINNLNRLYDNNSVKLEVIEEEQEEQSTSVVSKENTKLIEAKKENTKLIEAKKEEIIQTNKNFLNYSFPRVVLSYIPKNNQEEKEMLKIKEILMGNLINFLYYIDINQVLNFLIEKNLIDPTSVKIDELHLDNKNLFLENVIKNIPNENLLELINQGQLLESTKINSDTQIVNYLNDKKNKKNFIGNLITNISQYDENFIQNIPLNYLINSSLDNLNLRIDSKTSAIKLIIIILELINKNNIQKYLNDLDLEDEEKNKILNNANLLSKILSKILKNENGIIDSKKEINKFIENENFLQLVYKDLKLKEYDIKNNNIDLSTVILLLKDKSNDTKINNIINDIQKEKKQKKIKDNKINEENRQKLIKWWGQLNDNDKEEFFKNYSKYVLNTAFTFKSGKKKIKASNYIENQKNKILDSLTKSNDLKFYNNLDNYNYTYNLLFEQDKNFKEFLNNKQQEEQQEEQLKKQQEKQQEYINPFKNVNFPTLETKINPLNISSGLVNQGGATCYSNSSIHLIRSLINVWTEYNKTFKELKDTEFSQWLYAINPYNYQKNLKDSVSLNLVNNFLIGFAKYSKNNKFIYEFDQACTQQQDPGEIILDKLFNYNSKDIKTKYEDIFTFYNKDKKVNIEWLNKNYKPNNFVDIIRDNLSIQKQVNFYYQNDNKECILFKTENKELLPYFSLTINEIDNIKSISDYLSNYIGIEKINDKKDYYKINNDTDLKKINEIGSKYKLNDRIPYCKQETITKLKTYLILQISYYGNLNDLNILNNRIFDNIEFESDKKYNYEPISIIFKHGDQRQGHYINCSKRLVNNKDKWVIFNDQNVISYDNINDIINYLKKKNDENPYFPSYILYKGIPIAPPLNIDATNLSSKSSSSISDKKLKKEPEEPEEKESKRIDQYTFLDEIRDGKKNLKTSKRESKAKVEPKEINAIINPEIQTMIANKMRAIRSSIDESDKDKNDSEDSWDTT